MYPTIKVGYTIVVNASCNHSQKYDLINLRSWTSILKTNVGIQLSTRNLDHLQLVHLYGQIVKFLRELRGEGNAGLF